MKILLLFIIAVAFAFNSFGLPVGGMKFTAEKRTSKAAEYKTPEAAVKAFIIAWRKKNRVAMLKIAEKDVVDGVNNLIKGSTFRSCQENTESAQKAYNCTVQAGDDDLTAVYFEVVLTRIGYRIMAVDFAAAH